MPIELVLLIAASLLSVTAMRVLPQEMGPNTVASLSLITLTVLSWVSSLWLLGGIAVSLAAMEIGDRTQHRTLVYLVSLTLHVGALLLLREQSALTFVGGSYFTLRHIHVLSDWWINEKRRPPVTDYLRYHLFLPVLAAGPIHRFEPFRRQLRRRRNDPAELAQGAERMLIGAFQFTVVSNYLMRRGTSVAEGALPPLPDLLREFVISALDWVALYFAFAGLSSVAIGLSLMMGLRIEENFSSPWRARDLLEFWSRWHMSLTTFSRDYIFRPMSAWSGTAIIGAFSAMLFIGLWHGSTPYWLGWGIWQGLGIILTLFGRRSELFKRWPVWTGRVFAATWLAATAPVVSRVIEWVT